MSRKKAKRMATRGYFIITVKEEFLLLESPGKNKWKRSTYG
jgi:hypothetical protein